VPANSFTLTIPQSIVWGLMGCVVAFAVSLAEERQRGTLMRLSVAPLPPWKVLAGKALACFITGVAVQVFLITVGVLLLGVRVADWPMLGLAVVVAAFAFTGVMTLLAALGRSEAGASGVGRAAMLLLAMLGGGAVPLMFMPGWMQTLASVSPFKWALLAVEGAVWRGSTPLEMALPLGVLLGAGVVCLTIGAIVLERTRTA
jgi:ABC-2 type transport system permease protein